MNTGYSHINTRINLCAPALEVLAGKHGVSVQDARKLDLKLNGAVEVEDPVHAVLVVSSGEDVRDDELAGASHRNAVITEVGVLEQNPSILFVDTDSVFDRCGLPGTVDERCIHVVYRALAVAA